MSEKRINALALIVGVMKCGTTSAFRYLSQHPRISACSIKEPGFFAKDRVFAKGLDWYFGLWDWDPSVHAWALEASTEYTDPRDTGEIARRIAATGGDVRILCVVRDPIKRIESQYNHAYCAGWLARDVSIDQLIEKRPLFIDRSRYAMQLAPYREVFGADRILVINASELSADPDREMARVVGFLGLPPYDFADLKALHNPGRGRIVESTLITRLRRHRKTFEVLQRVVPSNMQEQIRKSIGTPLLTTYRLSATTRKRILELLEDDLKRLQAEYGVDISMWESDVEAPVEF